MNVTINKSEREYMSTPITVLPSFSDSLKYLIPGKAEAFLTAANESGNSAAVEMAKKILRARPIIYASVFCLYTGVVIGMISFICLKIIENENPGNKNTTVLKVKERVAKIFNVIAAINFSLGTVGLIIGQFQLSDTLIRKNQMGL